MTSTDGLNLDQVQIQWRESQKLLDELRNRLESLATASQSAAASASSIQNSERALGDLVAQQAKLAQDLDRAFQLAVDTLSTLNGLAQASDTGLLSQEMRDLAEALQRLEMAGSQVREEQSVALKQMAESFTEANNRLTRSVDAKEEELTNYRKAVDRAIDNLPSRFQSRFRGSLP